MCNLGAVPTVPHCYWLAGPLPGSLQRLLRECLQLWASEGLAMQMAYKLPVSLSAVLLPTLAHQQLGAPV